MDIAQNNTGEKVNTISTSLQTNIDHLKQLFKDDDTIIFRDFENAENQKIKCFIVYLDAMVKTDSINEFIIKPIVEGRIRATASDLLNILIKRVLLNCDLEILPDNVRLAEYLINGYTLLFIENITSAIAINTKGWKVRGIEEPPSETIVRGPREGFTEALNVNISLLRRRLKTPDLTFKFKELGSKTKTKICISYINGIAQESIIAELEKRLNMINIDGVLDSGYIEELIKDAPHLPFRTIGTSERPDVIAGKLLEGRIAVLCDGSPVILTLPYIFMEAFQSPEDYYNNYMFSSLNRLLRWFGYLLTTTTPSIYTALVTFHQELIPTQLLLSIAEARQGVPFPTIVEALGMLTVFEILREAGLRMPKPIGQAVSIVGALVLGDAAVNARLVSAPMVIITALTGISSFLIPQNISIIVVRLTLLLLSAFMGLYGYMYGIIGLTISLMTVRSFGIPYMLYVGTGTINFDSIKDTAIRAPLWFMTTRPKFIGKDSQRQSGELTKEKKVR
ncbi:MAG: spore germination protein [Clostridiaceae bacterium]|nr:spore germination protein [Clostridiaceae bacterium]